jgi:hypothetical protein
MTELPVQPVLLQESSLYLSALFSSGVLSLLLTAEYAEGTPSSAATSV